MNTLGTEEPNRPESLRPVDRRISPWDDFFVDDSQRSLAVPHPLVASFLTDEFGWAQLGPELFDRECRAVGSATIRAKGVTYARADATREALKSLASVPFADPEVELVASWLGRYLGKGIEAYFSDSQFEPFVRERRRGSWPSTYKIAPAISIEGAIRLATHVVATKDIVTGMSATELVRKIQEERLKPEKRCTTPSNLGHIAIDRFMSEVIDKVAADGRHLVGLPPPVYRQPQDDPQAPEGIVIDESHDLSIYGIRWRNRAVCKDEDPDLFMSTVPDHVEQALDMCTYCPVKGDCLLTNLTLLATQISPPEGTAGGTTQAQRDALSYREVHGLIGQLERTRPSAVHASSERRRLVKMYAPD